MNMYTVHYAHIQDPVDAGSVERAIAASAAFLADAGYENPGPAMMVEQHNIFGGPSRVVWKAEGEQA